MAIKKIDAYPISIPLREPFVISLGRIENAHNVICRIETEDGLLGWGEASPSQGITGDTQDHVLGGLKLLRPLLLGKDPFDIAEIEASINKTLKENNPLKAALDMALLDLMGKAAGKPVCRILGRYRGDFRTDYTVGIKAPEEMAKDAKKLADLGFDAIKVKVGVDPLEDVERIRKIREAVGDAIKIRADANQGWNAKSAVRAIKKMERYDIELIEQPVLWHDIRGLKWVKDHVDIPVMADESVFSPADAMRLVELGAVDMFNIKLMKCGGIRNGMRIASIAEAAGMECMVGCMVESKVAITAASHLVASARNITRADLDSFLYLAGDPVEGGIRLEKGRITLPETPGLGISGVKV